MLTPVQWPLALYPGLKFDPLFEFFTDAGRTQPFDLTGFTAQLEIGNGLLVLTSSAGLTLGGKNGTVQALAGHALTAPIPVGPFPWFLEWTSPNGEPDCPVAGTVTVKPAPFA